MSIRGILAALYFLLCYYHTIICALRGVPGPEDEELHLIETLMADYAKQRMPNPKGVNVSVDLLINEISLLSEISSEFVLDIFFSEIWKDPALAYGHLNDHSPNITLDLSYLGRIWQPNICIVNSKQAEIHSSPSENVFLILYADGRVWRNCRIRLAAPCTIDLKSFPFDTQPCTLMFESYSYNADKVHLSWLQERPPVTLLGPMDLPDFSLDRYNIVQTEVRYPNGRWDQLSLTFYFKRQSGFFVLQAYVPTYMVIFIAWINFWMDPKELSTRATLTISAFLAMTLQFGNVLSSMPRVSYIKAIDIWMLGGIIFLFISLAELAIISFILRSDRPIKVEKARKKPKKQKARSYSSLRDQDSSSSPSLFLNHNNNAKVSIELKRLKEKPSLPIESTTVQQKAYGTHTISRQNGEIVIEHSKEKINNNRHLLFGRWSAYQIDLFFLIMFPPSFLCFNVFYWATYLPRG